MWLFEDGHIASRESVSGTVQLQVNQMPELIKDEEDLEPVIVLQKLDWHQDMQLKSIYRQRAKELRSGFFAHFIKTPKSTVEVKKLPF